MVRIHSSAWKVLTLRGPWVLRSSVRQMQLLPAAGRADRQAEWIVKATPLVSAGTKTRTLAGLTPESDSVPTFSKVWYRSGPGALPLNSTASCPFLPRPCIMLSFFFFLIYLWLHWVFVAVCGLSLVVASGGYSLLWCSGFSLQWLLFVAE